MTTCAVAANEKAYLEEYGFVNVTGLPDHDRCLSQESGMAKYLDRMSAQVVMREYLIHNNPTEENILVTEMLLNTQSMKGGSGQTDVY